MQSARIVRLTYWCAATLLVGCVFAPPLPDAELAVTTAPAVGPDPQAERLPALDTRVQPLQEGQRLIGTLQVLFTREDNTFTAIAREYGVGYDELRYANPGVDHWLPGHETPVLLPTQHLLPAAPQEGIVINVAALRLFHFSRDQVRTYAIGIGRQGWATPTGVAKVTQKARDPVWYVPASVRKEHAEAGDPLPAVVPPGPDNPLGAHAIALSMPGYLIHGTNKPAGVGMRVSHGCVRLYPADVAALFEQVPVGTAVRIVNEPVLVGWHLGQLYLEVHPPLEEDERDLAAEVDTLIASALEEAGVAESEVDRDAVANVVAAQRGLPVPVLRSGPGEAAYLASARIVENTVPLMNADEAAAQVN